MLPVGALRQDYDHSNWTKFTQDEQITMLSLWCMMRAPLIVGANLPQNDAFTLQLLTNPDILEIERTTHCAHQLYRTENEIVWIAPRKDGNGIYLALFNISEEDHEIVVDPDVCGMGNMQHAKELWTQNCYEIDSHLSCIVKKHGAAVFHLTGTV